jgi:quinol monooxygenase YgiN
MFVVAAQYYAKEGKDNEIATVLQKTIPISRAEPGCAMYLVNRSLEDPRKFLMYEQYHDRSGYEAHMTTDAFKESVLGKVVPMLESRVRDFYELVTVDGN